MKKRIILALCAALALPAAAQAVPAAPAWADKGVVTVQKADGKADKQKASPKERAKLAKAQSKQLKKAKKQKAQKPKQAPAT
jgi:hypothetical protein